MRYLDKFPCDVCGKQACVKHGFCEADVYWAYIPSQWDEDYIRQSMPCLADRADTADIRHEAERYAANRACEKAASGWEGVKLF